MAQAPVPARPNYSLGDPQYHPIKTIRPLIEVHWGVYLHAGSYNKDQLFCLRSARERPESLWVRVSRRAAREETAAKPGIMESLKRGSRCASMGDVVVESPQPIPTCGSHGGIL